MLLSVKTSQTVALEELNSEYIALKQGQGNKENLSAVLVSLRARYDDIKAKVSHHPITNRHLRQF